MNTTGPEVVYAFHAAKHRHLQRHPRRAHCRPRPDRDQEHGRRDLRNPTATCVTKGCGVTAGTAGEMVSFSGDPSYTYFIAVDGKAGKSGNYHIKLSSTACGPATCQDGFSISIA